MNRIKELQEQCVIHKGTVLDFDYDRFAELIVQDCLNMCDWQVGQRIQAHFEYRDNRWPETPENPRPF